MITIRAGTETMTSGPPSAPVRNETVASSRPVSQLAAVFSQTSPPTTSLPLFVRLPQEPLSPSELGRTMLPATLPSGDNSDSSGDIIKAQQQRIAELEKLVQQQQHQPVVLQQQPMQPQCSQQQTMFSSPQFAPPSAHTPQLQNSNLVNTKHLLAQQIYNKQNNVPSRNENIESMDDVIDSLLKTEGNEFGLYAIIHFVTFISCRTTRECPEFWCQST